MGTEKQLVIGLDSITGIYFTCPGCKQDIYLKRETIDGFYTAEAKYPCPVCVKDKTKGDICARYSDHFKYMADILCDKSHFKDVRLRLIIAEK